MPGDIEATNEVQVAAFRAATPAAAFDDYAEQLPGALAALAELQGTELSSETFSLENAGTYPVHLAAESLVFDHYCHLRHDVTVEPAVLPALPEELCVEALHWAVRWLVAGLPQMSPRALDDVLTSPVSLELTGPGGGRWTLHPAQPRGGRVSVAEDVDSGTIVSSPADDFVRWGTKRTPWRDAAVVLRGDTALAQGVADAIHVF